MKLITSLFATGLLLGMTLVHAQITTFANRADWLSNISLSYSDNFDAPAAFGVGYGNYDRGLIHYSTSSNPPASIGVGEAGFPSSFLTGGFLSWDADLSGGLKLDLGGEYTAFGLDFGQFFADAYPNDRIPFNVTLDGASAVNLESGSGYTFVGITSDVPFSVVFLDSAINPVIDNLALGSRVAGAAVPEPSTYGLLGAAVLVAVIIAHRRQILPRAHRRPAPSR
jgi:hypothetical protein